MASLPLRSWLAACLLLAAECAAQTITATNLNDTDPASNNVFLYSDGSHSALDEDAALIPLTPAAHAVPSKGLSGPSFVADTSNQLNVTTDQIVFISCDTSAYPGNIDQTDVFVAAVGKSPGAIVFYSQELDSCSLNNSAATNDYPWVFSIASADTARAVLAKAGNNTDAPTLVVGDAELGKGGSGGTYSTGIQSTGQEPDGSGSGSGNDDNSPPGNSPLGASPSTAVAMIILYSITGIITALFLTIIVTGAVRAHRHPERYGPRAVLGMPRQSRAKGLGRAILDTIPIVKVGQRNDQPKPADVELGETEAGAATQAKTTTTSTVEEQQPPPTNIDSAADDERDTPPIASAAPAEDISFTQGCSICTEDFQPGQDQRVLPCDHRYHPECIDPWLLNVSSTCPLCRVDLRPPQSEESVEPGTGTEAVEVFEQRRRGRGLVAGFMGLSVGRMEGLSREERVDVLRRYRAQQRGGEGRGRGVEGEVGAGAGEESGRGARLRRLFARGGIRTRRTERGEVVSDPDSRA